MLSDLIRRIERLESAGNNTTRVGTVTSTNPAAGRVRVRIDDADGMISRELSVVSAKTSRDKDYWMPDIGDQVVCQFLNSGLEQGFVLGSIYSTVDAPPVSSQNKRHVKFADGTFVEYDRSSGVLTVNCVNEVNVKAASQVVVKAGKIRLN